LTFEPRRDHLGVCTVIKYLGSKRTLIPDLVRIVSHFPELTSATDLFSGTARVGHALKRQGLRVHANDMNAYAHALAMCYVVADRADIEHDARQLIAEFNQLPGEPGYFTRAFCESARFFQPKNGAKVDAIREAIEHKSLPPVLRAVLLVSLMEAADRVDSTCGVHMAYVKNWATRAWNDLELRLPDVLPGADAGPCTATQQDALEAAMHIDTDIVYIDPPYNQHSYLSNYHIWETLVLWDKPDYYGVACKRQDCKTRKSLFNLRHRHAQAFSDVVERAAARAPLVIVSFNDEGFQTRSELESLLRKYGDLYVLRKDFKRYVGAKIGIHNPAGERVGEISHLRNEEHIYILATTGTDQSDITRTRLNALMEADQQLATPPADDSPETRNTTDLERRLLSCLRERGPQSARDLERLTGLTNYRVQALLRRLVKSSSVELLPSRRPVYRCVEHGDEALGDCPPKDAAST